MVTQKIIDDSLKMNVSYLFSIPLYNIAFNMVLKSFVINTYLYNEEDEHFTVLLKKEALTLLENYIEKNNIHGYISHDVVYNVIVIKLDKSVFFSKDVLTCIEENKYGSLKNTDLYKKYIKVQSDTYNSLQKHIVEESDFLNGLLEIKFKTNVNGYWKAFNIEEETVTLQKIIDMSTELKIQKDWILAKIKNADILSKIVYEDVLSNAKEELVPMVNSLTIINYESIYENVKGALVKKCGKPQYNIDIKGSKYPLMCNFIDFKNKLSKVIKKYKLEDINKVETILINHVNKLQSPLLKYYIEKDNSSNLASDYECYVEVKPVVNKIETKNLF